ncbi:hypothetical protein T4A_6467 [Trichinella pseudospiralis]|uniref:Uncharacterized protein n=1 Tax=Trichinella pseudospiralis TaxID=6337 RepID=A0A0V1EJ75_TRIPS|nr:hypothetical protein T4A_6467 [Trichinella pseudospiralis]
MSGSATNETRCLQHYNQKQNFMDEECMRCCLKENDTSKMERRNDREVYVRRGSSDAKELIPSTTGHCGQPCIERGCAFQSKYLNC